MSASDHNELAQKLANARASHLQLDPARFDAIESLDDAYRLQALATSAYPSKHIGYKVGATNEGAQKLFGCDAPFHGPMFEQEMLAPSADIPLRDGILGGEAEFAFLCGKDFPTDANLTTGDLPELIKSCHIAVELVGRRTKGAGLPSLHSAIADYGANVAFIPGPAIDNWSSVDLATVAVKAQTNGTETNAGAGSAVLGHPLNSLLWLHNSLLAVGNNLKAGDWVSTGTCLGVIAPVAGSVEIEFTDCGTIGYQLT